MEFTNDSYIYLQIMNECKRRILANVYKPNDKIPSIRELALEFNVTSNTIQHALNLLDREGLFICSRNNSRYVCDDLFLINELKRKTLEDKVNDFLKDMDLYDFDKEDIISMINQMI